MTDRPTPDVEARLARLAARGRAAAPSTRSTPPRAAPGAPPRRKHPAEASRLLAGALSVATALGIVAGLAWGSRQPVTAQPSITPTVVVVPDSASGSGSTGSSPSATPAPVPAPPSTTSGGS